MQFLAWFDKVESLAQDEENKCYKLVTLAYIIIICITFYPCRDYIGQLSEYQDKCSNMLTEIDKAVEFLAEMSDKHTLVAQKTGALHQACEQLVEEQVRGRNCLLLYFHYPLFLYPNMYIRYVQCGCNLADLCVSESSHIL